MSEKSGLEICERAIVVVNEHSSNHHRIDRQLRQLGRSGLLASGMEYIHTTPNKEELADALYNTDFADAALVVSGGDGTHNNVINVALSPAGRELGMDKLPIIFARGGNASDFATMLNGRATLTNIVRNGQMVKRRPLEISISDGEPRYALGYIGIGGTAAASQALSDRNRSAMQRLLPTAIPSPGEGLTSLTAIRRQAPFIMTQPDNASVISDALFMRGPRMAKIGRSKAQLDKPQFSFSAFEATSGIHTFKEMLKVAMNRQDQTLRTALHFGITSLHLQDIHVPIQLDGEAELLPFGREITIAVSGLSYTTLTVKKQQ